MVTETKFKNVEEILEELIARAKKGSCKKCQYCETTDFFAHETRYVCAVQGNYNPNTASEKTLNQYQYPIGCDGGTSWIDDNGKGIPYCLAYEAKWSNSECRWLANRRRAFVDCLRLAAELHYSIKENKLDEMLRRLNTEDFEDYYPWDKEAKAALENESEVAAQ